MRTGGQEEGLSRRAFLAAVVAGVAMACTRDTGSGGRAPITTAPAAVPAAPASLTTSPFTLGVASGDPLPDSVILWTRLAPEPLTGGGMGDDDVEVLWEIATTESFDEVVVAGLATARAAFGHSIHVDATGLEPDTWYTYRFRIGEFTSPVGRTRTAPAPDAMPASGSLKVGFASCQSWQSGFYTAYPHLIDERPDLVLFLGDYIYEGGVSDRAVRQHNGPEVRSLADYRNRYALYKSDGNLQAAHAACPWVVTWDDHEVENDYAGSASENADPVEEFDQRRAAAYQAFYEHHPVRVEPPRGPALELYRKLDWGRLASFFVLDGRQHRSDQACSAPGSPTFGIPCGDETSPSQTMLGTDQRDWLLQGIGSSTTIWDVLANQTVMARLPIAGAVLNFDQWDGYDAERRQILDAAAAAGSNLIVVTGDIHAFGVADLQATENGPTVGTEFVGGAISSTFPQEFASIVQDSIGDLPQVRFADLRANGYGVLELTEHDCRCWLRGVTTTAEPTADVTTLSSWVVEAGTPGARPI
jgi:alkaline phosphatase D